MKTRTRFLQSIAKTASDVKVEMPWTRGARRQAFIAKRARVQKQVRTSA